MTKSRPASKESARKRDPERSRQAILDAATREFANHGFGGARVDRIAASAGANKRMIYHYFGNKEALFRHVLEAAYERIRTHEQTLELDHLDPVAAVRTLVDFTFGYFIENPEFIRLLNNENLYDATHTQSSERIPKMHFTLVSLIDDVLKRGAADGVFRSGVDPVQFYISIASLGYFYLSNASTLQVIFSRDLRKKPSLDERQRHIEDVILGYLRPETD